MTETYVYDAFGKLAAEYSTTAPTSGGTFYRTIDHLGSTRLVTKQDKSDADCYDYAPFGEEIPNTLGNRSSNACFAADFDGRHRFTGKERDDESDLDYFLARYYSGPMGRFLSVDPENAGADPAFPQTWNAYAYVNSNPLKYVDPDGQAIQASLVNSEVANQLSIIENDQGQFLVGIEGSIIDFQKAGDLEASLGAMIASDTVVDFQLSETVSMWGGAPDWINALAPSWLTVTHKPVGRDYGGEATIDASKTPSGRTTIAVDPNGINDRQATREGIPGATLGEATAHGFGHAQAFVQGIYGPGNRAAALRSENAARRRGGRLRLQKRRH